VGWRSQHRADDRNDAQRDDGVKTSNSVAVELIRVTEGRDTEALGGIRRADTAGDGSVCSMITFSFQRMTAESTSNDLMLQSVASNA